MENQCLGLAEAVGATPVVKRIRLQTPWRQLSPYLPLSLNHGLTPDSDTLAPPWPDLLITSGRQAVGAALAIRRQSASRRNGGHTFCVHIQNPGVPFDWLDLVVMPAHDRKIGPNVMESLGALHRVTAARLAAEAARFAPALDHLPHPRVAVLVGGSNGVYQLTPAVTEQLAERLAALARQGMGLMVTPSRRTGPENEAVLRQRLAGPDLPKNSAVVWDGAGANPYFGYLGLADAVLCTGDSVSMVSEAASTGKPVYVIGLEGKSAKFDRFHQLMVDRGVARPFTGAVENWTPTPLDDTPRVAAEVLRRMAARR
ncbi:mitochondrial fission ELM1 family protein [Nitrospirillum sp. BR 11163]|uniref:mitochondrial fission ELM1 family protein n=1 Tax=Nitrospirillum sp. BR 11163 TaxID=3104323 RepID=UPI002AFE06AA|nr:mitochondrial fission ELM1 family protein [Nitrospirillum sp. BR 11163]MEA1676969.1 mitochondrial fission ELM1 family protein [Nitrospirillum sp. BR 11163]